MVTPNAPRAQAPEGERRKLKKSQLAQLAATAAILAVALFVSSRLYFRADLTTDRRFSVSPATKEIVAGLEDVVFFKIYLEGDLPSDFKELRQATMDLLNEFRSISPINIQYDFVNPSEDPDPQMRREVYNDLVRKGLRPYTIRTEEKDGVTQKYVFPGMTINYRERQLHVNLLTSSADNPRIPPSALVNEGKSKLEYTVLNAIKKVTTFIPKSVVFLDDLSGLKMVETYDAALALSDMYQVGYLDLNEQIFTLVDTLKGPVYDVVVITKPQEKISDKNKFLLDQYIMHGGKVLWLLDYISVDMDSLAHSRTTTAMPLGRELNLDDMLFNYGVRVNPDVIKDLQAAPIPVNTAVAGAEPQYSKAPWFYFPVVIPTGNHPITRNVGKIKLEFPGTIDTVRTNTPVKKSILLTTSEYARATTTPFLVDLAIINERPDPNAFRNRPLPVALLLEGEFESIFRNRLVSAIVDNPLFRYRESSKPTAMIVVADGDIIKNYYARYDQELMPYPLGTDKWFKDDVHFEGNKEFILNAVNYLTGDPELMSLRGRKLQLRLLDRARIVKERKQWQIINVAMPLLLVAAAGITFTTLRRRKYTRR